VTIRGNVRGQRSKVQLQDVAAGVFLATRGLVIMPSRVGALSDIGASDVCLSVCRVYIYIGPKSRTERPRKTKIGTEVAHVTRDSDTTFKIKTCRGRRHIVAASHAAC